MKALTILIILFFKVCCLYWPDNLLWYEPPVPVWNCEVTKKAGSFAFNAKKVICLDKNQSPFVGHMDMELKMIVLSYTHFFPLSLDITPSYFNWIFSSIKRKSSRSRQASDTEDSSLRIQIARSKVKIILIL